MTFQLSPDGSQASLLRLTAILFFSYLCIGLSLPVVPLFVSARLGLGNAWAGLAVGAVFFVTIATRGLAGSLADRCGARLGTIRGLTLYAAGSLISALSGLIADSHALAYLVLIAGRLCLGLGESLVAVGVIAWGIGLVGAANSGRVLALVGAAIYGALAVGGPIGLALFERWGFSGTMLACALISGLGLLFSGSLPAVDTHPNVQRPSSSAVLGQIWRHGLIVCLQGIGFAAIGAFFALHFHRQGWSHAGLGLTAFGIGFVLVRLFLGHLPDQLGGLRVALVSLAVEAIGQALIWGAGSPELALLGAFLTGLGCSLIFPAMGREVVQCVSPLLRGAALGSFTAFQDLAYGLTGPLAGLLADRIGYRSVFMAGGVGAAAALLIVVILCRQPDRVMA
ncbi:arabinose transporter [Niveibacterium terrae]|uniref:arabinose transporter n=1 Tax=Niveibacterium terrae TaxID=3373598 RepID=UPI003A913546